MDNISFKSRIRLVEPSEFVKIFRNSKYDKFVDYPYTIKESVKAKNAITTDVYDCTACGITDGQQVFLCHICPTVPANTNFELIKSYIKRVIDITDENLQGFLLGSTENNPGSPNSSALFEKFVRFFEDNNIPFSQFKGCLHGQSSNTAYFTGKDEWLISNELIKPDIKRVFESPLQAVKSLFEKVEISDFDEICW